MRVARDAQARHLGTRNQSAQVGKLAQEAVTKEAIEAEQSHPLMQQQLTAHLPGNLAPGQRSELALHAQWQVLDQP